MADQARMLAQTGPLKSHNLQAIHTFGRPILAHPFS